MIGNYFAINRRSSKSGKGHKGAGLFQRARRDRVCDRVGYQAANQRSTS